MPASEADSLSDRTSSVFLPGSSVEYHAVRKKKIRIVLFLANRRGSGTLKVFPLKLALSQLEMIVCVIDSVCDI